MTETTETTETTEETTETQPKQSELDLAKAKELIEPLAVAGKSEDDMVVVLIQDAEFSAKKAFRYVRLALEALGVRMSSKERYEAVCELLLENDFQPTEWDEVKKVADYLAEEIDSTTEKQALVAIRKFAKENGIELPKRPKGGGGGRGAGFRGQIIQWCIDNATASDDDFTAWMTSHEKPESLIKRFIGFREMARKIHVKLTEAGV
jgi:hypothetical protein